MQLTYNDRDMSWKKSSNQRAADFHGRWKFRIRGTRWVYILAAYSRSFRTLAFTEKFRSSIEISFKNKNFAKDGWKLDDVINWFSKNIWKDMNLDEILEKHAFAVDLGRDEP